MVGLKSQPCGLVALIGADDAQAARLYEDGVVGDIAATSTTAISYGRAGYRSDVSVFDNLHLGVPTGLMNSLKGVDPVTESLLEPFNIDLDRIHPVSPELMDIVNLLCAFRRSPQRLLVAWPIERIGDAWSATVLDLVAQRSEAGQETVVSTTYGSQTYQRASELVLLSGSKILYQGAKADISEGRVRLLTATSDAQLSQLYEAELSRVPAANLDEFVKSAAAFVGDVYGQTHSALAVEVGDTSRFVVASAWALDGRSALEQALELVEAERPSFPIERSVATPTGTHSYTIRPLGSPEMRIRLWIVSETDGIDAPAVPPRTLRMIADRAEEVLQTEEADRRAREFVRVDAIASLVGGIAHDLNNSLQGIIGSITLVADAVEGDVAERLDSARALASDSAAFVHRLLAFSRTSELRVEPVDVHSVIHDVVAVIERGTTRPLEISSDLRATPHVALLDEAEFRGVLLNVALNAAQAAGETSRNIEITTESLEERLVITVVDDGPGIPDEIVDSVFEPFVTGDAERGTGLGLAIARSVITALGGEIRVESTSPQGTTVRIELVVDDTVVAPKRIYDVPAASPMVTGKVLICDDDVDVLDVLGAMVRRLGYTAITTSNPLECVPLYRDNPDITVVMIDQIMPERSGDQVLADLLSLDPELGSISLSGYRPAGPTAEKLGSLATLQMTKPVDLHELAAALETVAGSTR